jgi:hypothetical protein
LRRRRGNGSVGRVGPCGSAYGDVEGFHLFSVKFSNGRLV